MNKRIIKSITALALTVALCPTVPTLAAEVDYKDIYFDFIRNILNRTDLWFTGVQISDLNLDGTPELILYDSGHSSGYGLDIFEIVDNKVELRYTWSDNRQQFNINYLDSNIQFSAWKPNTEYDNEKHTFVLRKNHQHNNINYTLSDYLASDMERYETLYLFSDNRIVTANEKLYRYVEFDTLDDYKNSVYESYVGRIDGVSASQSEYETAYNEFMSVWQDTGYKIAYRDINDNTMTDQEIKDFLNSYIPERKALGLDISVTVNGSEIDFDQPPVIVDERTLVPLRAIFEALGATVDWNGNTQTVTSTLDNTTVALTIGSNTMYKNGEAITLDVPAQLIGDRTLVPVRAIAEAYGATVDWEQATYTVKIQK